MKAKTGDAIKIDITTCGNVIELAFKAASQGEKKEEKKKKRKKRGPSKTPDPKQAIRNLKAVIRRIARLMNCNYKVNDHIIFIAPSKWTHEDASLAELIDRFTAALNAAVKSRHLDEMKCLIFLIRSSEKGCNITVTVPDGYEDVVCEIAEYFGDVIFQENLDNTEDFTQYADRIVRSVYRLPRRRWYRSVGKLRKPVRTIGACRRGEESSLIPEGAVIMEITVEPGTNRITYVRYVCKPLQKVA